MDDKRKQFTLPLDLEVSKIKPYVQQSFNVTFARQKKVSVLAKRMITTVLASISREGNKMKSYYRFHASDVAYNYVNEKELRKAVKQAFNELVEMSWYFEDPKDKDRFTFRHLVNTTIEEFGYHRGWITIGLNPILEPYFVELSKNYTTYQLKHFMHFKSWYSMRLFEILSHYKTTGWWVVSLEEYRELMDCKKKYKKPGDLLKKTLAEPLKELAKTKLAFEVENIYPERKKGQKGKLNIQALKFTLKNTSTKEIPSSWYDHPEHRKMIEELQNKWSIETHHIKNYANVLKPSGIKELMRTWKEKETSNKRIDNRKLYCNASFVREAQKNLNKK